MRIRFAFGLVALLLAAPASAQDQPAAWDPQITESDRVLGSADAPVTILEYASFTCPHCAAFHRDTYPALKRDYIDTGKVRFVFRDFPLDGLALRASLMARCVPAEQYFNVVSVLFQNQEKWATAADPVNALGQIGAMAGLPQDRFNACLADQAATDAIVAGLQQADTTYGIDSTPTFIVGGEKLSGAQPIAAFAQLIERQIAAAPAASEPPAAPAADAEAAATEPPPADDADTAAPAEAPADPAAPDAAAPAVAD